MRPAGSRSTGLCCAHPVARVEVAGSVDRLVVHVRAVPAQIFEHSYGAAILVLGEQHAMPIANGRHVDDTITLWMSPDEKAASRYAVDTFVRFVPFFLVLPVLFRHSLLPIGLPGFVRRNGTCCSSFQH